MSTIEQLEKEAKQNVSKQLLTLLQRSDQLEKVNQYKQRIIRKKISVETTLKTAMQSQLDGVLSGIQELKTVLDDMHTIKGNIHEMKNSLQLLPPLGLKLSDLRAQNNRHVQYVTAIENLTHVFAVPDSVERTKQWISEGKLLHAHQSLMDLEKSRDELMYETHKLNNQSMADKLLLQDYFSDVEKVNQLLEKQIKLILGRTLLTVRKEPTVIVTALRIIEREEHLDQMCLQKKQQTNYLPIGTPKQWRKLAMGVLEESVSQKIEGTQVDERGSNKMWLVMYLELIRQLILEDLRVVTTLCGPCFPPHYNIVSSFMHMYHECLSIHLEEMATNLEGNEIVSMLAWAVNTYPGVDMMSNPELGANATPLGPVLREEVIKELENKYVIYIKENYVDWMRKTLETEKEDWKSGEAPDSDGEGHYHTAAPVIIFQMIDQNLQLTKDISQELTERVLLLSVEHVTEYGKISKDALRELKQDHFKDRSKMVYFTHFMIATLNNCLKFVELAHQMKQTFWKRSELHRGEASTKFEALLKVFEELRNDSAQYLLEEAFLDLLPHFEALMTANWLKSPVSSSTIVITLDDYFQDYRYLVPKNLEFIILEAEELVVTRYIASMLQKKITFKTYDERKGAAQKINRETNQLKALFSKYTPKNATSSANIDAPLDCILALSEVLMNEDAEMLSLDLHTLLNKYPDISDDHISRLLALRGDLSRSEIQDIVSYVQKTKAGRRYSYAKSFFHKIP
uniref:Exocyst complex component 3 n=1 Tax=Cacopsylla melanoneura TaxID=428564 RepID=A0A8D8Y795_9HEMI